MLNLQRCGGGKRLIFVMACKGTNTFWSEKIFPLFFWFFVAVWYKKALMVCVVYEKMINFAAHFDLQISEL